MPNWYQNNPQKPSNLAVYNSINKFYPNYILLNQDTLMSLSNCNNTKFFVLLQLLSQVLGTFDTHTTINQNNSRYN